MHINEQSYIKISYDFDITQFVNGDIMIGVYFMGRKLFVRETEIKYCVELFINLINHVINKDKKTEKGNLQNLVDCYILYSNELPSNSNDGSFTKHDIAWKTLFDLETDGFLVFLYRQKDDIFIEINQIAMDQDLLQTFHQGERYPINTKIRLRISKERLEEWLKILKRLQEMLGSNINT